MTMFRRNSLRRVLLAGLVLGALAMVGGVGQSKAGSGESIADEGLGVAPAAALFSGIYLEIEGVEGESAAPDHKGEVEVLSWSWGLSQTSSMSTGAGGAAGREKTGHVTLIKRVDKATPQLFERCAKGTHFPHAVITLSRFDGQTYLQYELEDVAVDSFTHGGDLDGDGMPDEAIGLTFGGAKLTHTQYDTAGRLVGQASAEW